MVVPDELLLQQQVLLKQRPSLSSEVVVPEELLVQHSAQASPAILRHRLLEREVAVEVVRARWYQEPKPSSALRRSAQALGVVVVGPQEVVQKVAEVHPKAGRAGQQNRVPHGHTVEQESPGEQRAPRGARFRSEPELLARHQHNTRAVSQPVRMRLPAVGGQVLAM